MPKQIFTSADFARWGREGARKTREKINSLPPEIKAERKAKNSEQMSKAMTRYWENWRKARDKDSSLHNAGPTL